jgi:hypothetical protein
MILIEVIYLSKKGQNPDQEIFTDLVLKGRNPTVPEVDI